jgi:hypothetical protein
MSKGTVVTITATGQPGLIRVLGSSNANVWHSGKRGKPVTAWISLDDLTITDQVIAPQDIAQWLKDNPS